MNQFTIPQFIDVEDKIFGPITTRQFVILLVTALVLFIAFKLADTALFIACCVIFGGLAIALAFIKINGQSFHYLILNIFETVRRPRRRLWNKTYTKAELVALNKPVVEEDETNKIVHRPTSATRIRDLSLLVNTGGYYKPET